MIDTHIPDLLVAPKRPLLSVEFFPPKTHKGFDALNREVEALRKAEPDFVTVTFGAGGGTRQRSLSVCRLLKDAGLRPVMPHLTCVGATRSELLELIQGLSEQGFRNIMALRGDPPTGEHSFVPVQDGLAHASDLIQLIKEHHAEMACGAACYPEVHPEAASASADLEALLLKQEAGADFFTTQLFYDNAMYFDFCERAHAMGITRPILPGIMPVASLKQVDRFTALCGASFPAPLRKALEQAGGDGAEAERVGIRWAIGQIYGLLAAGAPGIHLYVLNRSRSITPALLEAVERDRAL